MSHKNSIISRKKAFILLVLFFLVTAAFYGHATVKGLHFPGAALFKERLKVYRGEGDSSGQDKVGFGDLSLTGYNHDLQFAPGRETAVFSGYNYPAGGDGGVSSKLLLLDLAQNTITALDEGEYFRVLGWDARGENVLYMKDSSLYRLSLREGKKNLIAEDCHYGSFNPDGRRVAYVQRNNGLWVSDPDGANRKRLTATTGDWYPVWYPDGRHLFFFNDLGQELGDGAGHLQGMAKISVTDGTVERILPQKTGKFRSAEWILPGRSLHVISGWDDGFYQHIVDLAGEKITDLGENFGSLNYATAIDTAGGRLIKISAGGKVQILDEAGQLQKSFDLNQDGRVYLSAACAPDGRNVLVMSGKQPGGEGPEEKRVSILDVENGSLRTLAEGGGDYEACFWAPGCGQVLILEMEGTGSSSMLSGFTTIPAGLPGQGEDWFFTPVQESALSDGQRAFVEEVRKIKGIHRKDDLYVVALGEKPNPGYGLEIIKTEMSREQGRVYIKLTRPDPGKFYAAVITYPYLVGKANLPRDTAVSFLNIETGAFLDLDH